MESMSYIFSVTLLSMPCVYLRVIQGNLFDNALVVAKFRLFSLSQINRFFIARKGLVALCVGVDSLKQCEQYLINPI